MATLASYTTDTSNFSQFGQTGSFQKIAQPFTVSLTANVTSATANLRKENAPADHLQAQICSDNAGSPGTVLETSSTADPSTTLGYVSFTFAGTTLLSTGVTYWLVLSRTGALNNTNDYIWEFGSATPPYADAQAFNGTSWSNPYGTFNANFTVIGTAAASGHSRTLMGVGT